MFLVAAALSGGFALLAPLYRRRFVELFLSEVADYAVARALSFKSSERAFDRLVFAYFDSGHSFFSTLLRLRSYFFNYLFIIQKPLTKVNFLRAHFIIFSIFCCNLYCAMVYFIYYIIYFVFREKAK